MLQDIIKREGQGFAITRERNNTLLRNICLIFERRRGNLPGKFQATDFCLAPRKASIDGTFLRVSTILKIALSFRSHFTGKDELR